MACTVLPRTWEGGFVRPAETNSWEDESKYVTENGERAHYTLPVYTELPTSTVGNELGLAHLRTWPSIYDGTSQDRPECFHPPSEVDVLICGGRYNLLVR
jgi:phenol 2-monooxygenase